MIRSLTSTLASVSLRSSSLCQIPPPAASAVALTQTREKHERWWHRDYRLDYRIFRDPPLGPHKKLAPAVKFAGRVGEPGNYRRIVHFPEDGKYTIKKLPITKLGGRDQVTGRKVIGRVGGGRKQKYRWIDWKRLPDDWDRSKELVEKVISINYDPMRTAQIMLTGYEDKLRWQIATTTIKVGDLIRTSGHIPKIPVRPMEGDSYPLGALPVGTQICLVQWYVDSLEVKIHKGDESGTILKRGDGRVVIKSVTGFEYSLDERCQCVVGKVLIHPLKAMKIGSPNRARWMGHYPHTGLWHRKTGRFGRKVKKPPPIRMVEPPKEPKHKILLLHSFPESLRGAPIGRKRPKERPIPW